MCLVLAVCLIVHWPSQQCYVISIELIVHWPSQQCRICIHGALIYVAEQHPCQEHIPRQVKTQHIDSTGRFYTGGVTCAQNHT
jgi:hypothetical protein